MLRISLNSYDLDLPDNISIEMTAINPMFTESGFDEAYSYSFQVPITSKNKAIINRMESKYGSMKILFSNVLIEEGVALVKSNMNSYSIDFKNQSLDLRQQLEKVGLKSLPLESIDVCDSSDSVPTKLTKWIDHMTQVTITDPVNSGSHKFPNIKAYDDSQSSQYFQDAYAKNPDFDWDINAYWNGEFLKNVGFPTAYNGSQPAWWTSVSPCIRIQYLFDQLMTYIGVIRSTDELADIAEFQQMIHFSLLMMDKVETYSGNNYNVHGTTINLTKFTPDLNGSDLFKMLDEQFGIFCSVKGNKLSIKLKKNVLNLKPVDVSKFCNPNYEIEYQEGTTLSLKYPIDLETLDRFDSPIWNFSYFQGITQITITQHAERELGSQDETTELELSYIPIISRVAPFDRQYPTTYSGSITDLNAMRTYFYLPLEPISRYYDEQAYNSGGSDRFIIGCIRGVYPMMNYDTSVYEDKLVVFSSDRFYPVDGIDDHNYTFGTCSMYINDNNSHVDVYLKRFLDYTRRSRTITKMLYLPLHVIQEIKEWKNPNHIVKQRNLSFRGTVREINFTLYKNSISPAKIKYAVLDPERQGDYNDDYNEDFLI